MFRRSLLAGTMLAIALAGPAFAYAARHPGWDAMCARGDQPFDFCSPHPGPASVSYTPELEQTLQAVNEQINASYRYSPDAREHWTLPRGGTADCEDYVLAKIVQLARAGVPVSAMSIAAGQLYNGRWHAVLSIRTSVGDAALDSRHGNLAPLGSVGFRWGFIMSMRQPGNWVAL